MAVWQHDYVIIPRTKLMEFYGQIPVSVSEEDYNRFDWWGGVPEPNPVEIEKILLPTTSWSDQVKIWGSDNGNRFSLYYGDDGQLQSVKLRVDLRKEFPEVREFIESMIRLAQIHEWMFCAEGLEIFTPDYEVLAKNMNLSNAQNFMNSHPAANFADDL